MIIKLGAYGDIIQVEGALHDIRENNPEAVLTVLTTPGYEEIFTRCPWVDNILIDKRLPRWRLDYLLKLRRIFHNESFDMVFDLQCVNRTSFYFRWLFPPNTPWSGNAPGCLYPVPQDWPDNTPNLVRLDMQLNKAGINTLHTTKPFPIWMADEVTGLLEKYDLYDVPYILFFPSSSKGSDQKRWPFYPQLADILTDEGWRVVTVPGPGELELCRGIQSTIISADKNGITFFQLTGIIKNARYVIGNDTGPSHMASHLGVPGLALFGSHCPSKATGIGMGSFKTIDTEDLKSLPVEMVFGEIQKELAYSKS